MELRPVGDTAVPFALVFAALTGAGFAVPGDMRVQEQG
jgi:hypothetical protein